MKIQNQVLYELFLNGKECSVKRICKNLRLRSSQVYTALDDLKRRGLIKKQRIKNESLGYCNSPIQILVKVDDTTPFKFWRLSEIVKQIRKEQTQNAHG